MKLSESLAFKLFDKHGILHPNLMPFPIELKSHQMPIWLNQVQDAFVLCDDSRVVVKADKAVGGKKKAGLVQICDISDLKKTIEKIGLPVIVEEFIPHTEEFFVALKVVREGTEIYYSGLGGIEVEQNWDKVAKILVPTNSEMSGDVLFKIVPDKNVRDWIAKLYHFFQAEDAIYLEINPFTVVNKRVMPLGVVLILDETAGFRHEDWPHVHEQAKTDREQKVAQVDSEIRGSIKLVEVPGGGNTGMMAGGAGAALFLSDAILDNGLTLANYAEFSGNPPEFAVAELVKQICAIPGVKNLVIGSGIANFTDVYSNFEGIIQGLTEAPKASKIKVVVQRLGPGEDKGMALMQEFIKKSKLDIQVFDRNTGMTEIVKKLL